LKEINLLTFSKRRGRGRGYLRNLQHTAVDIGLDGAVEPRAHVHLRVRRLRSQIPRGVTEGLTDRVDTDERTGVQEVLARNITCTLGVHLRPLRVRVIGQELLRRKLVLRIAVRRRRCSGERHGGRGVLETLAVVIIVVIVLVLAGSIGAYRGA